MAKEIQLTKLKKGTSNFSLIGRAKLNEFTFKTNMESSKEDSDWVYSQMNLGVDCGEKYGVIYAELMGGYGTDRENVIYVHGKKSDGTDDFENRFTVAWEDRFDEEVLKEVGDMCFITVALEEKNRKKFLSAYDAIEYIESVLEDGMVISVRGNLRWSIYNDNTQCKKEINYIGLTKAEEDKFKATFTQTILLAKDAIGKFDKETMTIPITCKIVEYFKNYNEHEVKTMLPIPKVFDMKIDGSDKEKATKTLKVFKVSKDITQLTVDGFFSRGEVSTIAVSEDDIPDDVMELIELEYITKEEVLEKMAFANGAGNKNEKMYIKAPHIKFTGEDVKIPTVDKIAKAYTENDLDISLILKSLGKKDALDVALENEEEDDDDNDDDWLADL